MLSNLVCHAYCNMLIHAIDLTFRPVTSGAVMSIMKCKYHFRRNFFFFEGGGVWGQIAQFVEHLTIDSGGPGSNLSWYFIISPILLHTNYYYFYTPTSTLVI